MLRKRSRALSDYCYLETDCVGAWVRKSSARHKANDLAEDNEEGQTCELGEITAQVSPILVVI